MEIFKRKSMFQKRSLKKRKNPCYSRNATAAQLCRSQMTVHWTYLMCLKELTDSSTISTFHSLSIVSHTTPPPNPLIHFISQVSFILFFLSSSFFSLCGLHLNLKLLFPQGRNSNPLLTALISVPTTWTTRRIISPAG